MTDQRLDSNHSVLCWLTGLVLMAAGVSSAWAADVEIWDTGASAWTDTFASGDPIDTGAANYSGSPQLTVDSQDRVYVAFSQTDGAKTHIYLVRYDGTDVEVWDNGASAWTATLADGDPIDNGTANDASSPQLAVDSQDRVYIAYYQNDGANWRIYLSRYDGTDVKVWDNGASAWTDTFADGDPLDVGAGNSADQQQLVVDSQDRVYIVFRQSDGAQNHIYLSRYDGTDVKIWDNGTSAWTDTFANGDPIDTGTANDSVSPQLAADSQDRVYVTFYQNDGAQNRIYLSRYDGTDAKIWDNGASAWTDTFANGDPIDNGTANNASGPQLAVDSQDRVYVTFAQSDGAQHIYLSRYDGTDVEIWDIGASTWTDTFTDGDAIDTGTTAIATEPKIAVDSQDRVFVAFREFDGARYHIFLSRYDGTDVEIWDNGASAWTGTFANGDAIDTGTANTAANLQLALDPWDRAFVTYRQNDASYQRVYLSHYDGADAGIWDNGASAWTDTFANGDPIDAATGVTAAAPQVAVDSNGRAYVTFYQTTAGVQHTFLSRFNVTAPQSVTTTAASSITGTTASGGGSFTDDGGGNVTARGVCWNTTGTPTTAASKTTDGTGTGSFTSSLTGLSANTTYYVRAYATNSVGTGYGNQVSFTTDTNPTVTTTAMTSIASATADSGGNVTADGGGTVTARGACWNTTGSPTTADSKTTDGTGAGSFTSNLIGLSAGTAYYVRAYATNSVGTSYGNQVSFTTDATTPTVTTTAMSNIASTTADSGGNVTADGGASMTACGVCWNTTGTPTTADSKTADGTATGSFTSKMTGLSADTTYYVRAYASNSVGTTYGDEVEFTTLSLALTPLDPGCGACGMTGMAPLAILLLWLTGWRQHRRRSGPSGSPGREPRCTGPGR